jgi:hypothetical protein
MSNSSHQYSEQQQVDSGILDDKWREESIKLLKTTLSYYLVYPSVIRAAQKAVSKVDRARGVNVNDAEMTREWRTFCALVAQRYDILEQFKEGAPSPNMCSNIEVRSILFLLFLHLNRLFMIVSGIRPRALFETLCWMLAPSLMLASMSGNCLEGPRAQTSLRHKWPCCHCQNCELEYDTYVG